MKNSGISRIITRNDVAGDYVVPCFWSYVTGIIGPYIWQLWPLWYANMGVEVSLPKGEKFYKSYESQSKIVKGTVGSQFGENEHYKTDFCILFCVLSDTATIFRMHVSRHLIKEIREQKQYKNLPSIAIQSSWRYCKTVVDTKFYEWLSGDVISL